MDKLISGGDIRITREEISEALGVPVYAPLLHLVSWFPVEVVLPFTVRAVISATPMSRLLPG